VERYSWKLKTKDAHMVCRQQTNWVCFQYWVHRYRTCYTDMDIFCELHVHMYAPTLVCQGWLISEFNHIE